MRDRFRGLPLPPWVVMASAATVVLSLVAGFASDAKGFAGNLLAELGGVLGGILLGALYIDELLARERKARWQQVAARTAETLRFSTVKATLALYLLLPAPRPPTADPFVANELGRLGDGLRSLESALHDETLIRTGLGVDPPVVMERVEPHLRVIREVILPRLLAIGATPDLVDAALKVEAAQEALEYHSSMHVTFGTPPAALVEDARNLVASLETLVRAIESSIE